MAHDDLAKMMDSLMERWLAHDRQRQEAIDARFGRQSDQINQLSKDVATLTADVRTLVDNQKGLFNRTQPRPINWVGMITAFVGAVTLWGTATWLLLIPINDAVERFHKMHAVENTRALDEAYRHGRDDADVRWLKLMEDRSWKVQHAYDTEHVD